MHYSYSSTSLHLPQSFEYQQPLWVDWSIFSPIWYLCLIRVHAYIAGHTFSECLIYVRLHISELFPKNFTSLHLIQRRNRTWKKSLDTNAKGSPTQSSTWAREFYLCCPCGAQWFAWANYYNINPQNYGHEYSIYSW